MWEIYAYHNSEQLAGIFNAVVMLMGAGSYTAAFAAVVFMGFVAALIAYIFAPEKLQGWKWLGTVILVFTVLIVPRVTVGIVDKTGGSAVRIVANVPYGLAVLGGLGSGIGNTLTELFETAFQIIPGNGALPHELLYQQNGMMFGSRLLQATRKLSLPDPEMRTDLINFVNNCTAFDIADGSLSASTFSTTTNLWAAMSNTNPARFTPLHTASGVFARPCDDAYRSIDQRMPAQLDMLSRYIGKQMHPALPDMAAQAAIASQIPQAYIRSRIGNSAQTAADLIRQNALINAVQDAAQLGCQKMSDPACMMMATGRATATASQNAAWVNGAKMSEQALPIIRNSAEAMIYAVFPLVVLMLMLTTGKTAMSILTGYLVAVVSIQLWPPLFAVLNYMASIASQFDQAASSSLGPGFGVLSLATSDAIYGNAISAQAVVSYLIIGIPMLAYALARGMQGFGTAMVGGLAGFQSIIGNHSASAALGNSTLGNVSQDQLMLSPRRSHAGVSHWQAQTGDWYTFDAAGRKAVDMLQNNAPAGINAQAKVSKAEVERAAEATRFARQEVTGEQQAYATALTDLFKRGTAHGSGFIDRKGSSTGLSSDFSTQTQKLGSDIARISDATGMDRNHVGRVMLDAAVQGKVFGSGAGFAISKDYLASVSASDRKILEAASGEHFAAARNWVDRVSKDSSIVSSLTEGTTEDKSLAATLTRTRTRLDTAQRSLEHANTRERSMQTAFETGITFDSAMLKDPGNTSMLELQQEALRKYGGNPMMAAAHLGAQAGNFQGRPTQPPGNDDAYSTESLTEPFGEGSPRHASHGAIEADHAVHVRQVLGRASAPSEAHYPTDTSQTTRMETDRAAHAREVEGRTASARGKIDEFSKNIGVARVESGRISNRNFLIGEAGREATNDFVGGITDAFRELNEFRKNFSEGGKQEEPGSQPLVDEAQEAQRAREAASKNNRFRRRDR